MKVKSEVANCLKDDKVLRDKLTPVAKKSSHTIYMWLWGNSENLLRLDVLECISQHTGLSIENLIDRG